jgi:phosphatidylethanolamine-binding protein (PEBP) family uncharacterized protein
MKVYYNNKQIKNNEFLKPSETQTKPEIKLNLNFDKYYTLVIYDPDAVGGTHIHWLVTNIKNNNINNSKTIIPYKGPAPPPNTGKHRYMFELYQQDNVINFEPMENKSIPINSLKKILGLTNYIYKIQFISQNESGGKTITKTRTKITTRTRTRTRTKTRTRRK